MPQVNKTNNKISQNKQVKRGLSTGSSSTNSTSSLERSISTDSSSTEFSFNMNCENVFKDDLKQLQRLFPYMEYSILEYIYGVEGNSLEKAISHLNNARKENEEIEKNNKKSVISKNNSDVKVGSTKRRKPQTQNYTPAEIVRKSEENVKISMEIIALQNHLYKSYPQMDKGVLDEILKSCHYNIEECKMYIEEDVKSNLLRDQAQEEVSSKEYKIQNHRPVTKDRKDFGIKNLKNSASNFSENENSKMNKIETSGSTPDQLRLYRLFPNFKRNWLNAALIVEENNVEKCIRNLNSTIGSIEIKEMHATSKFYDNMKNQLQTANIIQRDIDNLECSESDISDDEDFTPTSDQLRLYGLFPKLENDKLNAVLLAEGNDMEKCISYVNIAVGSFKEGNEGTATSIINEDINSKNPKSSENYKEIFNKELELHRLYPGLDELILNQILESVGSDKNACIQLINSSLGLNEPPKLIYASSNKIYRPISNCVPFSSDPVVMLLRFKFNVENDHSFAANSPLKHITNWLKVEPFAETCRIIANNTFEDTENYEYLELHHKTKPEASLLFHTYVFLKFLHLMRNQLPKVRFKVFTGRGNRNKKKQGVLLSMILNFLQKYEFNYEHFLPGRFKVTIKPFIYHKYM